jgi:adenylate kinase
VPEDVVVERISSRRVCSNCGTIYSVQSPPAVNWTCDRCGGEVVQRDDDTPEAINKRLDLYEEQTSPLIEFYGTDGRLTVVDGVGTPDEVVARLLAAVTRRDPASL